MKKLILSIIFLLIAGNAFADASLNAAGCTREEINSILSTASSSTGVVTVTIPSCSETTHTSAISINMSSGYANVTSLIIRGSGDRGTILKNSGWSVTLAAGKKFRITNLKLINTTRTGIDLTGVTSANNGFRVDNITYDVTGQYSLFVNGRVYGVVHNIDATTDFQFSYVRQDGSGGNGGNISWAADDSFGTADAVYIENSTITCTSWYSGYFPVDHDAGGRVVFRYNTMTNLHFGGHDTSTGSMRSNRHWEAYNNSIIRPGSWQMYPFKVRGGTGYIFNNVAHATESLTPFYGTNMIQLQNVRSNLSTYGTPWNFKCDNNSTGKFCSVGTVKACTTDANCDGAVAGSCIPVDGNTDGTGYPCRDQLGRTKNHALKPVSIWNNYISYYNSTTRWATVQVDTDAEKSHIVANRDYYISTGAAQTSATDPFNGTSGAGYGLVANRPTTCTTGTEAGGGVAYFATDENKLYRCTATNTWAEEYAPYTCPHPLADPGGEGSCDYATAGTTGYSLTGGVTDTTPPTVTSFYIYSGTTVINFSELITATSGAAFTVAGLDSAMTLTCPAVETAASSMTCTNSRTVYQAEGNGTYGYTGDKVSDEADNDLATIDSSPTAVNLSTEVEDPPAVTLTVNKTGTGCTITSSPSGIIAGTTTTADYDTGTVVTLGGYVENGWNSTIVYGGDCASNGTVTMSGAKTCTATCKEKLVTNWYLQ